MTGSSPIFKFFTMSSYSPKSNSRALAASYFSVAIYYCYFNLFTSESNEGLFFRYPNLASYKSKTFMFSKAAANYW